jgi:hypothetical protein
VNHFPDSLFEWKNLRQTVIMPRSAGEVLISLVFLVFPAFAHHSTAEFDLTRPASATGVVTRFEWSNPHSHIYLDVSGPDGAVQHWLIEIDGPRGLERMGWSKDSLKPGDKITCSGARAKDGSPRMRCTLVTLGDGARLQSQ